MTTLDNLCYSACSERIGQAGHGRGIHTIRGRQIDSRDISTIQELIDGDASLGRTALSRLLCEKWRWE
ncbi:MAG: hypothetical protein WA133_05395, partial [Syntrophales bacterium]